MRAYVVALGTLAGCSAVSDFDFTFGPVAGKDAGDAQVQLDAAPGLDARVDAEAGVVPVEDTGTQEDAACLLCCEITEVTETSCDSGKDEDCDGKLDCEDTDCRQSPSCCLNPTIESGAACTDGVDNDCDGQLDCAEQGCAGLYACTCVKTGVEDGTVPASCKDRNDNDCDQLVDCAEPGCVTDPDCCKQEAFAETNYAMCTDGRNNDCDLEGADCADSDCRAVAKSQPETGASCTNKLDDDCDQLADCLDSDCRDTLECCVDTKGQETVETSCADGKNNDCDAQGADCKDSDCATSPACCVPERGGELTAAQCTDKADNDCDGLIDCEDPQCKGVRACCIAYLIANRMDVQKTETSCNDQYDNDCDGDVNCKDSDCMGGTCGIIIRPPVTSQ